MSTKREINADTIESIAKLINLQNALTDCGIDATLTYDDENGIIAIDGEMWNGVNGNMEPFSVYLEDDGSISHCIEPATDEQILMDRIKEWGIND